MFVVMSGVTVPCLATAAEDIKLWNVESFTVNYQFNPHRVKITSLSWSTDGSVSLSCVTSCFPFNSSLYLSVCSYYIWSVTWCSLNAVVIRAVFFHKTNSTALLLLCFVVCAILSYSEFVSAAG